MLRRVMLLDVDSCMFNQQYLQSMDKNVVIHNRAFLASQRKENEQFSQIETGCFSLRQYLLLDALGAKHNNTGSGLLAIKQVADYLGTPLASLLMPDIFNDLPDGESYQRVTNPYNQQAHCCAIDDVSKLTILYAHMHHEAMKTPEDKIVIDCYDDLFPLLQKLQNLFTVYPTLMPDNVTLRLNQYQGDNISRFSSIKGAGGIDQDYRQTVKDMIDLTSLNAKGELECVKAVTPEALHHFKANRAYSTSEKIQSLMETINAKFLSYHQYVNVMLYPQASTPVLAQQERRADIEDAIRNMDLFGVELLMQQAEDLPLSAGIEIDDLPVIYYLLRQVIRLPNRMENGQYHGIHLAAKNGLFDYVKLFVQQNNTLLNIADEYNNTPLIWAARNGHEEIVSYLLLKGADVNIKTQLPMEHVYYHEHHNNSPLDWAKLEGYNRVAAILADARAPSKDKLVLPKLNTKVGMKKVSTFFQLEEVTSSTNNKNDSLPFALPKLNIKNSSGFK